MDASHLSTSSVCSFPPAPKSVVPSVTLHERLSNQIRIATQLRAPLPEFRNHRQISIAEAAIDVLRLELHGDSVLGADRDLRAHLAALRRGNGVSGPMIRFKYVWAARGGAPERILTIRLEELADSNLQTVLRLMIAQRGAPEIQPVDPASADQLESAALIIYQLLESRTAVLVRSEASHAAD